MYPTVYMYVRLKKHTVINAEYAKTETEGIIIDYVNYI